MTTNQDDWTELAACCAVWLLLIGAGIALLIAKGFV